MKKFVFFVLLFPLLSSAQNVSEVCQCADNMLSMMKEAKDVKDDKAKMEAIQEKYKAKMEKCQELDEGKSDDEKKKMEEEMKACPSYQEVEKIMKESIGASHQEDNEIFGKNYYQKLEESKVYLTKGEEKAELGDYVGAIAEFNKAMNIYPKYYYVCFERGKAKFNLNDYRGAISDFNKALEADLVENFPKYYKTPVYFERGIAKANIKDFSGAIEDYNKVIELDPDYDVAYFNRGLFKFELNDTNGACLDLSKAGELGCFKAYDLIKKYCN